MAGPERAAGRIGRAVGPVLIVVWTAVPLLWLLSLSLKGGDHINDGRFWPAAPTLHNYRTVFRTLDAYRIFDTVFVTTNGANETETVSFLAYRQTITRTALGLGSAVSVLLFASVVLIAVVFVKGFGVDLARARGER